jgi:hypothetical protein
MAHASIQIDLPELPDAIRARLVSHRAAAVEEGLRGLEYWHPGLFDAMLKTIDLLKAEAGVESVTVDFDGDDEVYPATIWAPTNVSLDERETLLVRLEAETDEILEQYPNLVLVAIL